MLQMGEVAVAVLPPLAPALAAALPQTGNMAPLQQAILDIGPRKDTLGTTITVVRATFGLVPTRIAVQKRCKACGGARLGRHHPTRLETRTDKAGGMPCPLDCHHRGRFLHQHTMSM